jgi:hypothetical protein
VPTVSASVISSSSAQGISIALVSGDHCRANCADMLGGVLFCIAPLACGHAGRAFKLWQLFRTAATRARP